MSIPLLLPSNIIRSNIVRSNIVPSNIVIMSGKLAKLSLIFPFFKVSEVVFSAGTPNNKWS